MPPERTFVVTGTDTEIGKTWVGCRLAEAWREAGRTVRAVKPIESGCAGEGEDGQLLAQAAGQERPAEALLRLPDPVAPPLAAERAGVEPDWAELMERTRREIDAADVALVEGAGGLLSPLTWDRTALDLAHALDAAAIVVAPDRLGAISHVRLVLGALDQAGVACVCVVLSAPPGGAFGNREALMRLDGMPPVYEAPRGSPLGWAGRLLS